MSRDVEGGGDVYLEVQQPYADLILSGDKTVETRTYALPAEFVGRKIHILRSPAGAAGRSAVPDAVAPEAAAKLGLDVVGWASFGSCAPYPDEAAWRADRAAHCVDVDAPAYGWPAEGVIYAWRVDAVEALSPRPLSAPIRRHLRSLFRCCAVGP